MKRFSRQFFLILCAILSISLITQLFALASGSSDSETSAGEHVITSQAAIVIDFDTGLVIFEHNADELRVPASMAKMVAAHVVFDAIRDGAVSLDTLIDISDDVSEFSYVRAFSNVPLPVQSSFSVRDLLYVVIVRSASAATIALGEGIFGSEEAMVAKMNEKALQLGISAEFFDSWGGSPDNRISARGMADMTRALIKEYPEILEFTSKANVTFDDIPYRNTNMLIAEYEGVDGFKTGFTNPAGWCFTATALQKGRRIISVTMGSVQGYRFSDSVILLDHGFLNYNVVIANHFKSAVKSSVPMPPLNTTLVPLKMYNIYEARYIGLRDLALILNEVTENKKD